MDRHNTSPSRRNLLRGGAAAGTFFILPPGVVRGSPANSKIAAGWRGPGDRGS